MFKATLGFILVDKYKLEFGLLAFSNQNGTSFCKLATYLTPGPLNGLKEYSGEDTLIETLPEDFAFETKRMFIASENGILKKIIKEQENYEDPQPVTHCILDYS